MVKTMTLNFDQFLPLYAQIAKVLVERIDDGRVGYCSGQRMPAESSLATEFDASTITVRAALQVLRNHGYIISKQGSGTYVCNNRPQA